MQNLSIGAMNNYNENLEELAELVKGGDAHAQFLAGWIYEEGKGSIQDYQLARALYYKSASQNFGEAYLNLGNMHAKGKGSVRNCDKAYEFYEKAAQNGFKAKAYYNLGLMFEKRTDIPRNLELAMEYFYKSANQGHSDAQYRMGKSYFKIIEEYQKYQLPYFDEYILARMAKMYYRKASEIGHAKATYWLGMMHLKKRKGSDDDARLDYTKAHVYFRKSAEQGFLEAQKLLANYYETGIFAIKYPDVYKMAFAFMWYIIAEANGGGQYKWIPNKENREYDDWVKAKVMAKRCLESDYADCGDAGLYFPTNIRRHHDIEADIFKKLEQARKKNR